MRRSLPITLVTGFLGAGKTSLLHHLISEQPGGHLAILVESNGSLELDGKAIRGLCGAMRRQYDVVVDIPSDGEAVRSTLNELAQAGRFERVLVEVSGTTLATRWLDQLGQDDAHIEQIVCVVDLLDFHRSFLVPRRAAHPPGDFQSAQIQQATLLLLNKCDICGDAERQEATRALRQMNATAPIIQTAYGEVAPDQVFRPAKSSPIPTVREKSTADPLTLESAVYRAFRPFHPQRFWDWFGDSHPGVLRIKGIAWLATRHLLVGGISRTAWQNSCGAAGIWWAALPREDWPEEPSALQQIMGNWREPHGDRRQELLLIGEGNSATAAARLLNGCLLTTDEFSRSDWPSLPDPFPAWDLHEEE